MITGPYSGEKTTLANALMADLNCNFIYLTNIVRLSQFTRERNKIYATLSFWMLVKNLSKVYLKWKSFF